MPDNLDGLKKSYNKALRPPLRLTVCALMLSEQRRKHSKSRPDAIG